MSAVNIFKKANVDKAQLLTNVLGGAGIGAAGLGLTSAFGGGGANENPAQKRKRILKNIMLGGGLGGMAGVGLSATQGSFNKSPKPVGLIPDIAYSATSFPGAAAAGLGVGGVTAWHGKNFNKAVAEKIDELAKGNNGSPLSVTETVRQMDQSLKEPGLAKLMEGRQQWLNPSNPRQLPLHYQRGLTPGNFDEVVAGLQQAGRTPEKALDIANRLKRAMGTGSFKMFYGRNPYVAAAALAAATGLAVSEVHTLLDTAGAAAAKTQ